VFDDLQPFSADSNNEQDLIGTVIVDLKLTKTCRKKFGVFEHKKALLLLSWMD